MLAVKYYLGMVLIMGTSYLSLPTTIRVAASCTVWKVT